MHRGRQMGILSERRAVSRLVVALGVMVTILIAAPSPALAWQSLRHDKCFTRANGYAAADHPNLTPQEVQERTNWLYAQCAENDAVEAFAEEQGSMAPALFPNTEKDRHAHPLHCMSLSDNRFGMHTNHNSPNPPPDPNGPGGAAAVNIPGEFMYAFINGKARFLVRYVVWTIDDRNGDPVTPVKINQHPTYMGTPQVTVAVLDFAEAYQPVSIWVEMPDNMAVANIENSGVLPGRRLTMRTWMASKCHDKRDPTVIPHMLINHMQSLGWLDSNATAQSPRAVRFVANGNPNQASSWALTEVPVDLPPSNQIFTKNSFKWFYDSGVIYNGEDTIGPAVTVDHSPGEVFPGPAVTLSGVATDATAVAGVQVTVENSAGNYLQSNGTFGPGRTLHDATLGSPGATSTPWSIDLILPEDSYDLEVMGEDTLGNASSLSNADFVVDSSGPDTSAPLVDMDHEIGTQFTGPVVTITGTSSDNVGVTSIDVEIKNRVTKQYLQPDGSFGPRVALPATLDNPGATSTTWSITVNIPAAGYNIESFAYDAAGNVGDNPTWKKFDVVEGSPDDVTPPSASVSHSKDEVFTGPDVTISGTATDDVGVVAVGLKVKDRDTGLWLQGDGSFAPDAVWHVVALANPGTAATTWTIDLTLPSGRYNPVARAFDAASNEGTQGAFLPFEVVGGGGTDTQAPSTSFDHAKDSQFSGPAVTLLGSSSDNVGVVSVEVKIKDRDTGKWLQADGSFANPVHWHDAAIDNAGATSATWSITFDLPDGRYNPVSRAWDAAGNDGTQTAFRPIRVV